MAGASQVLAISPLSSRSNRDRLLQLGYKSSLPATFPPHLLPSPPAGQLLWLASSSSSSSWPAPPAGQLVITSSIACDRLSRKVSDTLGHESLQYNLKNLKA